MILKKTFNDDRMSKTRVLIQFSHSVHAVCFSINFDYFRNQFLALALRPRNRLRAAKGQMKWLLQNTVTWSRMKTFWFVWSSDHVMSGAAGRLSSVGHSLRPRDFWKGLFGSSKWIDGQEKLGTQIIESREVKRERERVCG